MRTAPFRNDRNGHGLAPAEEERVRTIARAGDADAARAHVRAHPEQREAMRDALAREAPFTLAAFDAPDAAPSSLLDEVLGDGKANCLERAVVAARADEDIVYLDDLGDTDGNGAGHALLRDGDGRVRDPAVESTYRSVGDWIAAHSGGASPAYRERGVIGTELARDVLALPPPQRAAYLARYGDVTSHELAGVRVADGAYGEAEALDAIARDWDVLRRGDDSFGRSEIEALAGGTPPDWATPGLVGAARYLVANPGVLDALDTAAEGGSADGKVSIDDFGARLRASPLDESETALVDGLVREWNALRGDDQTLGRGELEALVGDEPPDGVTSEQIALARELLARPELLKYRLDVADEGGKPDGKVSADDLGAQVARMHRRGGTLEAALAPAALALGSEDDAVASQDELERGLARIDCEVEGGADALAPVVDAFDHDRNGGLDVHEMAAAFASGVFVVEGRTIRIEGLTKLEPGADRDVPLPSSEARIQRPVAVLTGAESAALGRPRDIEAAPEQGTKIAIGGDEVVAARAAYETVEGAHVPVIVATGASGREYAIDAISTPNLLAGLLAPDPATGGTLLRPADGLLAHHAVQTGGYTLPDGSRSTASAVPLGEQALTMLVARYRELGDAASEAQQKFIRMLEAAQFTTQNTDLGDDFLYPLSSADAGTIFDPAKVEEQLEAAFADPEIQADYAEAVRAITPDLAGTVERMRANLTSPDFALHVQWLRDAGQDAAAQSLIGDALLGLHELDPAAAEAAAAQLNVNVMDAQLRTTDIGDLREEEIEQAGADLLDNLGNAQTLIGSASGLSGLGTAEFVELRAALSGAIGNAPLAQGLAKLLKSVSAAGGSVTSIPVVRQALETLKVPLHVANQLKHLVTSLDEAGLWGSTVTGIGTFAAVNRVVGGHVNLGGSAWDRMQSATDFISVIGGASSFVQLGSSAGERLGWGNFARALGLDMELPDAAAALRQEFIRTTDAAVANVQALGAQAGELDAVQAALVRGGMTGDTSKAAAAIVSQVEDGVTGRQLAATVIRNAIRASSTFGTSGPGATEQRLATALVGVDLADEAAVTAALTSTAGGKPAAVADPKEAAAIARDLRAGVPTGQASVTLASADEVLDQYGSSLVPGAVEIDPAGNIASFTETSVRELATDSTLASILDDANAAGTTRIGLDWKQKIGFGINALGAVAETTGGLLNVVLGFKSLGEGVRDGNVKDIITGSLSVLSGGIGTFGAISSALRIGSAAARLFGPLGLVVDLVNVIVNLVVDPNGSPSDDFADGFGRYEDDGVLQEDWHRNARSWYLNAIDYEDSSVGS